MAKIKRECFTVVTYKLTARQVNGAIEMYLRDIGLFAASDAKYEVGGMGALVTSTYPNEDGVKEVLTDEEKDK